MMRIGHGFDVHAFGSGDHVMLGGERIAHSAGLVAHSDGDVVLHALCDALLGAAGLGDIGVHFPDTDATYADADSRVLLRQVVTLLQSHQWQAVNVKATTTERLGYIGREEGIACHAVTLLMAQVGAEA